MFLISCASQPLPPEPMCEYMFQEWERTKGTTVTGLFFPINKREGVFFVRSEISAFHELGHFDDMLKDFPSQTKEFKKAVKQYLKETDPIDPELQTWLDYRLNQFEGIKKWGEVYAELYSYNLIGQYELPAIFRPFFTLWK